MILRFLKIILFLSSFLFLTGFVPLPAVLGPAITAATSGNLAKATAQLVFDNEFKKKQAKALLAILQKKCQKIIKKTVLIKILKI